VDYSVRFIGHVDEDKRPNCFPETVELAVVYHTHNIEELKQFLNQVSEGIRRDGGLQCNVDLPGQLESDPEFGNGKFVPMHMFTHLSFSVRRLTGEVQNPGDPGVVLQ